MYDSFSIFRLFRNIFYLSYLAILPLLILFCLEQLRLFLETPLKTQKNRLAMAVFVVLAHLLFAAFLFRQGSIIITSYVTIFLSAVLFVLYFFQRSHREQPFFIIGLLIVILLQPAEVFYHYKNNAPGVVEWFPRDRFYPKFSFVRPVRREEINYFSYYKGRSPQALQDASGFESWKYTGLYRSYWLHENIQPDILENYVRHKFVVFDRTEHMDEKNWDFKKMETAFARRANVAFVSDPAAEPVPVPQNSPGGDQWQVITAPSDQFSVEAFDLNFIKLKTNFDSAKFFVYNDGYDRNWRASVNGRAAKIIKANYAFKGLWLPAGPNQIYLRYGSAWLYGFNIFMLVFYGAFFLYLLGLWLYPLRKGHKGT
ncbi:MAG: hypothetical protein A2787_05000 [Omnitrophica WOR_2 bacterium RIFCSPHIGHO2_01_FULL_48_9]|nr:MAG: hypothetical protein A2787_05000 [Omnitrophica WOR_2 bacterium RIFCSPHIGHO2_01_FULL_48_9]